MKIKEVISDNDEKLFIEFPLTIYKNEPNWIRPLDKDIKEVFDPEKNKLFKSGICARFLLFDANDEIIGRIAAFINQRVSKKEEQPTGGIGFFECINNKDAAHIMFDHCRNWLQQKGMEAMDGPINFGERDSWWGLLVEGFTPVGYKMNYNPQYYKDLFESYGFQTWFEQWCFSLKVKDKVDDKFYKRHAEIEKDPDYRAEHIRKNNLEKYAEDFRVIYNKAWAKHGGIKELDSKQVQMLFKKMKPIIDERIVWFTYYKNEPVAMWINIPDINQIFKRFNGKFGLIQKLKFVWLLKQKVCKKFIGIVFGVVPEHQGKGVDAFMIMEAAKIIQVQHLYDDYEMQWIGDFNPKMVSVAVSLGTEKSRVLKTYRYLFDRSKEFKRHPFLV